MNAEEQSGGVGGEGDGETRRVAGEVGGEALGLRLPSKRLRRFSADMPLRGERGVGGDVGGEGDDTTQGSEYNKPTTASFGGEGAAATRGSEYNKPTTASFGGGGAATTQGSEYNKPTTASFGGGGDDDARGGG